MTVLTQDMEKVPPGGVLHPTLGAYLRGNALLVLVAAVGWLALFWPTLCGLVEYWLEDPDFSHGFLVPVISGVIVYGNHAQLALIPVKGSLKGLLALCVSLLMLLAGALSFTNIVERLAAWAALASAVWFLLGFEILWRQRFAQLFLLLAIPPPFFLLGSLRLALKAIATRTSADLLSLIGYPAFAEGNVLALGEHQLEVADACSGIRSLMAILATAVLFAYLLRLGIWKGALLTLTAIPVTVAVNVLRILLLSVSLVSFDLDLTHGAEHEAVGFAVFGVSLALLYASARFYNWLLRWEPREAVS